MATSTLSPTWVPTARDLPLERGLRVAVLVALLSGAPLLAPNAAAQQPAAIRAKAYVTTSILAAAVRRDASPAAAPAALRPAAERVRIAGVGTLDVEAGPGEAIRVGPQVADPRNLPTVTIQIFNVGS